MGATTYRGTLGKKEADASLRPNRARPKETDWPSVILEGALSDTAQRLIVDGKWWIENSDGAVKMVLLFFVNVKAKTIRIEMWKKNTIENPQQTRGHGEEEVTGPTRKKTLNITSTVITGAPFKLQFRDIFLRRPKEELGEANYHITEQDMREFYNKVWPASLDVTSPAESCKSALLISRVNFSRS